jgi:hypothetical protein
MTAAEASAPSATNLRLLALVRRRRNRRITRDPASDPVSDLAADSASYPASDSASDSTALTLRGSLSCQKVVLRSQNESVMRTPQCAISEQR